MTTIIEQVLNIYLDALVKEGERFAKIKTLTFSLQVMAGLRRITLVLFFAFLGFVLFTAIIFLAISYNINSANPQFDTVNAVLTGVASILLFIFAWNLRERKWLNAFGIRERLLLLTTNSTPVSNAVNSATDEKLKYLIDQILEEKLKKLV